MKKLILLSFLVASVNATNIPTAGKPVSLHRYVMTDVDCLAINQYKEAGITSDREKSLVSDVVLNRATLFKTNACTEVFRRGQFSWVNMERKNVFASKENMYLYYNIPKNSYESQLPVVAEVILSHGVLSYTKKGPPMYYHDKSIKKFDWSMKDLKVTANTKYFVFYSKAD